jgi:predicted PurR-regulated permease PerM
LFKLKKIPHLDLIPILIIAFVLFKLIDSINILSEGLSFIVSLFSYFLWGFAIAYFLNPLMVFIEKKFKIKRVFSLIIVYLAFLGVTALVLIIIIPRIIDSAKDIISNIPMYLREADEWINNLLSKLEPYDEHGITQFVRENIKNIGDQINSLVNLSLKNIITKAIDVTAVVIKFIVGIIISVYMLYDKENFIRSGKKLLIAVLKQRRAQKIINFTKEVNSIFKRFIIGKTIDSAIIGIICFLGLLILGVPYAALISVIVGVTNMIPYFGPFIGAIPAVVITLFNSPIMALWVLIFIFLLQQFDGWYLGPKILGDKLGLKPFWIILAIVVGGGAFGVVGMFLGVPAMAVIKLLLNRFIQRRLNSQGKKQ